MPRGDGTGPNGQGSTTGRGMGNCQGNQKRLGVGYGKGNGNGMGQGNRLCFRQGQNSSSNIQPLAKDELTFLKNKASRMESNLNNVKNRISELEQDK